MFFNSVSNKEQSLYVVRCVVVLCALLLLLLLSSSSSLLRLETFVCEEDRLL
jgi:hypothetical protein